ncbi:MAG: LysM peptidoglycan-binding domain-containing protein, partial [Ferruginibacter sp.]
PEIKKEPEVKTEPVTKTTTVAKKAGTYPIYHKVAKKETLYHISKLYENVSIDDIKKWNKLTGEGLSEGTNLIVGYSKEPGTKPTEVVKENREEVVVKETPKTTEPEKKEAEIIVKKEPVRANPVGKEEMDKVTGKNFNGGIFRSLYDKQVSAKNNPAEEKGQAGIFKSTSGWEDGKYYCLTNSATPGSIVKITNPANQRSVYAKVLDLIPDLKQNTGLIIRISNAAASELGANADNFESTINF